MPYKTGSWGPEAQARSRRRSRYFKDQTRRYREEHADELAVKIKARNDAGYAIRSGQLVKEPCEVCGATDVHAHHEDYSLPLAVRWLCPAHHGEIHRGGET